jgi:hypothetical protein
VGDVRIVTRLDRLARSTRDMLEITERRKEVGARWPTPWADTTMPAAAWCKQCSRARRISSGR